ncbi:MAG: hypothetical protein GF398_14145 [Chitinivibrionales bacterium]|nr:hypothetical protein [Chitinivibrionales bacterium]
MNKKQNAKSSKWFLMILIFIFIILIRCLDPKLNISCDSPNLQNCNIADSSTIYSSIEIHDDNHEFIYSKFSIDHIVVSQGISLKCQGKSVFMDWNGNDNSGNCCENGRYIAKATWASIEDTCVACEAFDKTSDSTIVEIQF